jgi:tetratricopeptide (TPR) repeat protein
LIFAVLAFLLLRSVIKPGERTDRVHAITLLALLGIYFIDASLNFPLERPVTQFFFALTCTLTLSFLYHSRYNQEKTPNNVTNSKGNLLLSLLFVITLAAAFTTYSTFRSLKAQVKVNDDILQATQTTKWNDIKDIFPAMPNLNSYGFPISHIKAFYLMNEKKYDSALQLINSNSHVNPHLTLTEYLKARIFNALNNQDSAFYYSRKAFFGKPRAYSHYELLNDIALARKDSGSIDQAFREYIKYRNEARAWNRYIVLKSVLQPTSPSILQLVDSALLFFPQDPELQQKKAALSSGLPAAVVPGSAEDEYQKNFAAGFDNFSRKQYQEAIRYFTIASSHKPGDYLAVENIGLCYYSAGDYNNAIPYFDKVLTQFNPTDGKSEFLKGISLLNLGNKEGCVFLKRSMAKGFPQAAQQVSTYCQ